MAKSRKKAIRNQPSRPKRAAAGEVPIDDADPLLPQPKGTTTGPDSQPLSGETVRAKLNSIGWKSLEVAARKMTDAPLNQVTATAGFVLDRIDTMDDTGEDADAEPLHFSRLTDEDLENFERIVTILLGDSEGA